MIRDERTLILTFLATQSLSQIVNNHLGNWRVVEPYGSKATPFKKNRNQEIRKMTIRKWGLISYICLGRSSQPKIESEGNF